MVIKKKLFISLGALLFAVCTLVLSSCSLFAKKLSDVLPNENVISIERITMDMENGGEETSVTLSTDKTDAFMGIVGVLEYVQDYNIRGVKYIPFDEVEYVITYETYKVVLREHYLTIYKDEEFQDAIRIKSIEPIGKYDSLNALFEE